jgi:O-6-methylguanine DNA methyltransferase
MTLEIAVLQTPLGPLVAYARDAALLGLEFTDQRLRVSSLRERLERHLGAFDTREARDPAGVAARLRAYFAGDRHALDDQPVAMLGTPFERAVWSELRRIPAGTTISYAELARRVGRPNGSRAVGQANGRNPIALVVPCHRVIASDGSLAGYGGGVHRKQALLELERALAPALV